MNRADPAKTAAGLHLVVVAVDGSVASAVFGPLEILQACSAIRSNLGPEHQAKITAEILSPEGSSFASSNGHRLPTDGPLRALPPQSVVFFPGFGVVFDGRAERPAVDGVGKELAISQTGEERADVRAG